MNRETVTSLLADLLSNRLDIGKFEQQLGDVLFELRQDYTPNEDKKMLSRIQLYLHELDEGNRDIHEVYIAAQAALDLLKPTKRPVPKKLTKLSTLLIEPNMVGTTSASPAPEFRELRRPVPI